MPSGNTGTSYSAAYSYVTNQVSSGISPAPTYDANGNQTKLTAITANVAWNASNDPVTINGTSATYDALGRMVETGSGSTYQQYVYRPSGDELGVYSGGTLTKGLFPLPGGATAVYNGINLQYIRHKNWLGSGVLASTWNHAVYSETAYAPFGETYNEYAQTGKTADRSFAGMDQDVVTGSGGTGVYDAYFRKYDPSAGRLLSPDPLGWGAVDQTAPQSLNRYAYAMNNPMIFVDPNGLDCMDAGNIDSAGGGVVSVDDTDCEDGGDGGGGGYGGDDGSGDNGYGYGSGFGAPILIPGSQRSQYWSGNPCDGPNDASSQCLLYQIVIQGQWCPGVCINLPAFPYPGNQGGGGGGGGAPNNWVSPLFKKLLDKIAGKVIPASPWKPFSGMYNCLQNFSNDINLQVKNNFPNVSPNQAGANAASCMQRAINGMASPF